MICSPSERASAYPSRERGPKTPAAETSILGPIRTRARQRSILRSVDGPDSSVLDPDLDDFLPDDESTPLDATRKRKLSHTPKASTPAQTSPQADVLTTGKKDATNGEPDLPPLLSNTTSPRQQSLSEIDNDTMAPPRSSSSDPSPTNVELPLPSKTKVNTRKAREPKSLSTAALQALMPARRQQRGRRDRAAKKASEFDIPEDSSDPPAGATENRTADPDDEESYIANPKPTRKGRKTTLHQPLKLQKKKTTRLRNPNPKTSRKTDSGGGGEEEGGEGGRSINGKPDPNNHSTQSPSPSTSQSKPITHATPVAADAKTSSSSPSQQQHPPPLRSTRGKSLRSYSKGAREAEQAAAALGEEAREGDKENRPSLSSGSSSGPGKVAATRRRNLGEAPPSDDEAAAATEDSNGDISIEVGRSYKNSRTNPSGVDAGDEVGLDVLRAEQARLARKFREVDEWDLEFEDVSMLDEASDPLAR